MSTVTVQQVAGATVLIEQAGQPNITIQASPVVNVEIATLGTQGIQGEPGFPSDDAGNVLTVGTDGGLYYAGSPATWGDFIFWPSTLAGTATVSGVSGDVRSHTKGAVTVYRFIPSPYNAALDGFYSTYSGGVLSGLIVTRG